LLWFVDGDNAELRGDNVLDVEASLVNADALPAACRVLFMLHAACRHLKWECAPLLGCAASAASAAAESIRSKRVPDDLFEALKSPPLDLNEDDGNTAKLSAELERQRALEVQVRDLQVELRQLEAARYSAQTVEVVPVVVVSGFDSRI